MTRRTCATPGSIATSSRRSDGFAAATMPSGGPRRRPTARFWTTKTLKAERAGGGAGVHPAPGQSGLRAQLHSSLAAGNPPQAGMGTVWLAPEPPRTEPALADPAPLPDPAEPLDPVDPDPAPIVP